MSLHFILTFLTLAVFSMAHRLPEKTALATRGTTDGIERADVTISLVGDAFTVVSGQPVDKSLSDIWHLSTALLFCNKTTDATISHLYVEDLTHGLYAEKSSAALLWAQSGHIWKIVQKIGVIRGT
jgi:hypothetical protein